MDHIDERLTSDSINQAKFEPSIRASLALAKKTLNRYYDLTDSSEVYRIAMGMCFKIHQLTMYPILRLDMFSVLHPRHKLSYFKQAGWPTKWIRTAEEIVRVEFKRSYATDVDAEGVEEGEDNSGNNVFKVCLSHSGRHTID